MRLKLQPDSITIKQKKQRPEPNSERRFHSFNYSSR